jgi:hypothetical protein
MEEAEQRDKNRPLNTYSANGIQVVVWQNEGQNGPYITASPQRRYRDTEGNWKTSKTFRLNDLPMLAEVLSKVFQDYGLKKRDQKADEPVEFAGDDVPF